MHGLHVQQLDILRPANDTGILEGGDLNETYQILQLHFHWGVDDNNGSEHTLNNETQDY